MTDTSSMPIKDAIQNYIDNCTADTQWCWVGSPTTDDFVMAFQLRECPNKMSADAVRVAIRDLLDMSYSIVMGTDLLCGALRRIGGDKAESYVERVRENPPKMLMAAAGLEITEAVADTMGMYIDKISVGDMDEFARNVRAVAERLWSKAALVWIAYQIKEN